MSDLNPNKAQHYLYEVHPSRSVPDDAVEALLRGDTARPSKPVADNAANEDVQIVAEHLEYLQDLVRKKVVILFGRTLNKDERPPYGIVIFAAASDQEARQIMENDPAIKRGLAAASLYPYQVVGRS